MATYHAHFTSLSSTLALASIVGLSAFAGAASAAEAAFPAPDAPAPDAAAPSPDAAAPAPASTPQPETAPAKPAPMPLMDFSVPPPAPVVQRKEYLHEGFYLRFNVGAGYMYSAVNEKPGISGSGDAFGLGADLMIGGGPTPGFTVGGALFTNSVISVPFNGGSLFQFQFITGPFFDVYAQEKRGFHFGAGAGLAGSTLDSVPGGPAFGGGGALFVGYDAWISPEISAGFSIRGTGAYMAGSGVDTSSAGLLAMLSIVNN